MRLGIRLSKIPEANRTYVKANIFDALEHSDPRVQRQLIETIVSIAKIESILKWKHLVETIEKRMKVYGTGNLYLQIAHELTYPYRFQLNWNTSCEEIQFLVENLAESVTITFEALSSEPDSAAVETLTLCVEIFRSLNTLELTERFEDKLQPWMHGFAQILSVDQQRDDDNQQAEMQLHSLFRKVLNTLQLFVEKYDEEFESYIDTFMVKISNILMRSNRKMVSIFKN